jgi:nitroimidazol reductase NimA-like FMN-containing flavoprotein (pyridoxamine 5'-phosphate oxidase superfamily)
VRNDRSHELTGTECRKLLAQRRLGRVAMAGDDGPAVFPVNYALDRDAVLFHTDEPPRLGRDGQITLQVDDLSESRPMGWSVTVRGLASEVREPEELEQIRRLSLRPLANGTAGHYVRLQQVTITGRWIEDQNTSTGDVPSNWLG